MKEWNEDKKDACREAKMRDKKTVAKYLRKVRS